MIIVVDDDRILRHAFARIIREEGHHSVLAFQQATDAERMLEAMIPSDEGHASTLILMDVNLGVQDVYPDGCAAGRAMLRRWPELRILFVSGHDEQGFLDRCPGHPPFVLKPMPYTDLLQAIQLHLLAPPWRPLPDDIERRKRHP